MGAVSARTRVLRKTKGRKTIKYVLLGTLDAGWAGKQADRVKKAETKLKELDIKLNSIHSRRDGSTSWMSWKRRTPTLC